MELRHLRCFVAVAEELHFTKAAQRLRVAQPYLTRIIRELESIVGVQLLNRTRRSVQLTEAGQAFYKQACEVVHRCDSVMAAAVKSKIHNTKVHLLLDESHVATAVFDASGVTKAVNREFERMWGVCCTKLCSQMLLRHRMLREQGFLPIIEQAFQGRIVRVPAHEFALDCQSSARKLVIEGCLYPVKDEQGNLKEVVYMMWETPKAPATRDVNSVGTRHAVDVRSMIMGRH